MAVAHGAELSPQGQAGFTLPTQSCMAGAPNFGLPAMTGDKPTASAIMIANMKCRCFIQ